MRLLLHSPGHYSSARNFPIQEVLEQCACQFPKAGIAHVWFVEDNFLNNPRHAKEFCRELELLQCGVTWSCYATFPQLSQDLIEMMGRAGCTEVFCGIDAVGTVAERAFQKAFLKGGNPMTTKIHQLTSAGIKPHVCTFPRCAIPSHQAGAGLNDSVLAALEAQAAGANTLLNPLSLYSGTAAYGKGTHRFEPDSSLAEMIMDLPEPAVSNPFAQHNPELFPFHSRYVGADEWRSLLSGTRCVSTLIHCYPKTLITLHENAGILPSEVAQRTLHQFEDWTTVPREVAREVERDVGFAVLEELSGDSGFSEMLQAEYDSCNAVLPNADKCSKMEM